MRVWIALLAAIPAFAIVEPAAAHPSGSPRSASSLRAPGPPPPAHVTPSPNGRATLDGLAAIALASALVGLSVAGGRPRRVTSLATSLLLLAFVGTAAPHLVHHLLDPDQARHCEILKSANHVEMAGTVPAPTPAPPIVCALARPAPVLVTVVTPPAARGRAPPSL